MRSCGPVTRGVLPFGPPFRDLFLQLPEAGLDPVPQIPQILADGLTHLAAVLSALLTDVLSRLAALARQLPDHLLTLNVAVDLAVVQIRTGVTGLIVSDVSGIDDGTKNLIGLVHQRVGHADFTKHLRQGEVLGRDEIGLDVVVGAAVVHGRQAAHISGEYRRAVKIGMPATARWRRRPGSTDDQAGRTSRRTHRSRSWWGRRLPDAGDRVVQDGDEGALLEVLGDTRLRRSDQDNADVRCPRIVLLASSSATRQATIEPIDSPMITTWPSVCRSPWSACFTPSSRAQSAASGSCE